MASHIFVLFREVIGHWLAFVTGSVVSVGILIWEKWKKREVKWKTIVAIFSIGLLVSLFFAWQDEYTSAEWRKVEISRLSGILQVKDAQIQQLQSQVAAKDRPINLQVQTDPQVLELITRLDEDLANTKSKLPSPRKRALQLSKDVLMFLADRMRTRPSFPVWDRNRTSEQLVQALNDTDKAFTKWTTDMVEDYHLRFGVRVDAVIEDMQMAGLDPTEIRRCDFSNGNTEMIQSCGSRIGAIAEKLPQ